MLLRNTTANSIPPLLFDKILETENRDAEKRKKITDEKKKEAAAFSSSDK
jgi:hypothetical protein